MRLAWISTALPFNCVQRQASNPSIFILNRGSKNHEFIYIVTWWFSGRFTAYCMAPFGLAAMPMYEAKLGETEAFHSNAKVHGGETSSGDGKEACREVVVLYHLESRWRNSHVLVYHGHLQIATFWEWRSPSTFTAVHVDLKHVSILEQKLRYKQVVEIFWSHYWSIVLFCWRMWETKDQGVTL